MSKKLSVMLVLSFTVLLNTMVADPSKHSSHVVKLMDEAKKLLKPISPKDFYTLVDEDKVDFVQLDVRENNQYGHGEIFALNTVKLTRGYVEYKVEKEIKDKNRKIIVVCCSGKRALLAAKTMIDLGYTDVSYLEGGVNGWLNAGFPLDTVFGELYLKH